MLDLPIHPQTYLFSLFGRFLLPNKEEIWTGALIQAMAGVGFEAHSTRMLLSRTKHDGLIESRRVGRLSYYHLTALGKHMVNYGSEQLDSSQPETWDGQWTVAAYSIPEIQRKKRDELRGVLTYFGFTLLTPGLWISAKPLSSTAEQKIRLLELWQYLHLFRAKYISSTDLSAFAARHWPLLPLVKTRYQWFIERYTPVLQQDDAEPLGDLASFVNSLRSLCEFITISLADPALPPELLPAEWPLNQAAELFMQIQSRFGSRAETYFDQISNPH